MYYLVSKCAAGIGQPHHTDCFQLCGAGRQGGVCKAHGTEAWLLGRYSCGTGGVDFNGDTAGGDAGKKSVFKETENDGAKLYIKETAENKGIV